MKVAVVIPVAASFFVAAALVVVVVVILVFVVRLLFGRRARKLWVPATRKVVASGRRWRGQSLNQKNPPSYTRKISIGRRKLEISFLPRLEQVQEIHISTTIDSACIGRRVYENNIRQTIKLHTDLDLEEALTVLLPSLPYSLSLVNSLY